MPMAQPYLSRLRFPGLRVALRAARGLWPLPRHLPHANARHGQEELIPSPVLRLDVDHSYSMYLTYLRIYVYTYIHIYLYTCIHLYIYTYIYTYVHLHIYIHIHIMWICILFPFFSQSSVRQRSAALVTAVSGRSHSAARARGQNLSLKHRDKEVDIKEPPHLYYIL